MPAAARSNINSLTSGHRSELSIMICSARTPRDLQPVQVQPVRVQLPSDCFRTAKSWTHLRLFALLSLIRDEDGERLEFTANSNSCDHLG